MRGGTSVGQMARLLGQLALVAPTRVNEGVIRRHYDVGDDFHLMFLDAKYHLYSTLIFDGDETRSLAACRPGQVRAHARGPRPQGGRPHPRHRRRLGRASRATAASSA